MLENKIEFNQEICRAAINTFCDDDLFSNNDNRYEESFFDRRLRPKVLPHLDFSQPFDGMQLTYSSFAANRVLFAMNERDFLMLPEKFKKADLIDFQNFYSDQKASAAGIAMPFLEQYLYSFLQKSVLVSEDWSVGSVRAYCEKFILDSKRVSKSLAADAILQSNNAELAARDFLIQLAPDFLIESSPMARYSSGSFGKLSSELFTIIIDELGYGIFEKKHSTLFENTLKSVGLNPTPHYYWQCYLNGSLLLANYYNMITQNRRYFFRYIGAIFHAETMFIQLCGIWKDALEQILPNIDTAYLKEH